MSTTTNTFDCVAAKRRAQEQLRREYESRKNEFESYAAFLTARVQEGEWTRKTWQRFADAVEQ